MSKAVKGIVLSGPDKTIEAKAKNLKLPVTIDPGLPLAYKKTLFVAPGTIVPWDLLPAAWHFLERWDTAVPLWRCAVNACDVGSKEEQRRTKRIVRDLRVLLHSVELLFVRDNADGRTLMETYRTELKDSNEPRLAFLRALYQAKPRCCVLPRSWLAGELQRAQRDARTLSARRSSFQGPLVKVEIAPGRFVKCRPGDEEKVLRQQQQLMRRRAQKSRRSRAKSKVLLPEQNK